MSTDEERDRLAEQLAALPVHELVDVMRRVLPTYTEDRYGMRTNVVLASVTRCDQDPETILELVAWVDRDHYDGSLGIDQGLWENGHCSTCDIEVTSNGKRAFCPACGSAVALT
ncbi:hypothetical protein V6V47_04565 [Micromonospora sp. CPCC 205539]|uniref:hypothetical protein n=1 Tax=Micromonospora sp. CPCC 205539 TaxID=3122408 RepID=UPI002FF16CD9